MKTTGRCHCGDIEYSAEVDEGRIALCHCTDCQVMGGGPFRLVAGLKPGALQITKGQPRTYDKTADSGLVRRMHFCGTCGTQLYSGPPEEDHPDALISLRVTTSADRERLLPIAEIWCSSRLSWLPPFEQLKFKFEGQP